MIVKVVKTKIILSSQQHTKTKQSSTTDMAMENYDVITSKNIVAKKNIHLMVYRSILQ